jgi:hypothetical protein
MDGERDGKGRFKKGNRGGPGNPNVGQLAGLQAAMREVVTPHRLKALFATLMKAALERQDVAAARLILDRVMGRVRAEPVSDVSLDLPDGLSNSGDVTKAASGLLTAVASGRLSPEDGQRMAMIVEMARRALETQDFETRITELEMRARMDGS